MQFLALLLKVALFVLVLSFALRNTDPVTVRYYFGGEWRAPLVFVMLAAFAAGVAAGLFAVVPGLIRRRREIAALRRQIRARERAETAAAAPEVPPPTEIM